jgi:hypothetical protein
MKEHQKSLRLDNECARALRALAADVEGNSSFVLRALIRREARARGLWSGVDAEQMRAPVGAQEKRR